ncbi:DMT family transporter [Pseudomonas capeferrum]|uniref:DMT family transporter n=1 Tax=Pseudomonas capeferrum TaxID=1495066 RepID=UPI0021599035|nr:DMT family transporter [Pseudomonas capeferrum]
MFAAALHASWNAIVKAGQNKLLTTVLVTTSAAIWAAILLPFLPSPDSQSWPYIALSVALQILYFALLARIYRIADMSQTYPLMRGVAPLIVALAAIVMLGEIPSRNAGSGIIIICSGILMMLFTAGRQGRSGLALALLNAVVIGGYTLVDGVGVRLSAAPVAYTLWIFLLTGAGIALYAALTRLSEARQYLRINWRLGVVGGFGTLTSYGLALYAMTLAPVAVVAALRETSILFAVAISGVFLKEQVGRIRLLAVCVIALGAFTVRLA